MNFVNSDHFYIHADFCFLPTPSLASFVDLFVVSIIVVVSFEMVIVEGVIRIGKSSIMIKLINYFKP